MSPICRNLTSYFSEKQPDFEKIWYDVHDCGEGEIYGETKENASCYTNNFIRYDVYCNISSGKCRERKINRR